MTVRASLAMCARPRLGNTGLVQCAWLQIETFEMVKFDFAFFPVLRRLLLLLTNFETKTIGPRGVFGSV